MARHPFTFRVDKAVQAAGVILRRERDRSIGFMKLLKLLTIAEREVLQASGSMITGDRIVATEQGPLPSRIYDLIRGEHVDSPLWQQFIETDGYRARLLANPGVDQLSRFEIEKVQEVALRHANDDEWTMVQITQQFQEWIENKPSKGSSRSISIRDILRAVGREEEADHIIAEAETQKRFDDFFARHGACGKRTLLESSPLGTASIGTYG